MSAESPVPNNSSDSLPVKPDSEPNQPSQTDARFPVVGIVASAGGLEAFTELIRHLPTDTGMAFVLIQHLSPEYESLLSEILGRVTTMPVCQVQDQMRVEPNAVYVIPPNAQMTLVDGILRLAPRQKSKGKYLPADIFFESLATDRGNKAIAVVLSGMDGDGAEGVKAVKIAGGVTFAESNATAQFNSMPNTAVATGNVDFVLSPPAIAKELSNLSRNPFLGQSEPLSLIQKLPPKPGDPLSRIFSLLRTTTGVDFTEYKPASLERRIQRRIMLYKLDSLAAYAEYLQTHGDEIQALYEEILIHVTSFFRDPHVFEKLKTQIFPIISQNKASDVPLRIWVAGCSTGEEVYSLAICLLEFFSDRATVPSIQIFATDISETAISKARTGFYLESQMEGVSLERKSRFFVPQAEGGYQISSTIRELCVFAHHNLCDDPPFSNLDLISCRNVLIYLSDSLQERIMALFHYSLNLTGYLVLGTAESVKAASNLFAPVDEACKIYARKLSLSNRLFAFTATSGRVPSLHNPQPIPENFSIPFDLAREVDQLIANRYMPLSVVVDEQMQILQVRGDLDLYLKLTPSSTELNLLSMAREGLVTPLRTALYQAQTENVLVRQEDIQMEQGERTRLNLEVLPFRPAQTNTLYFVVLFNPISPSTPASNTFTSAATVENLEPSDLARELVTLRQALSAATQRELSAQAHLQAVIQEQNQLNQNLRIANEEILSTNEELQSTNEELKTAKEEIQATNEELSTTNEELRSRNLQQNRDNSDLNNFIASINIPIVMLTNDLRIRRFTPTAQRLFNFIPTDIGRPLTDLHGNLDVSQLEPMILEVLETLNTKEQEIQTAAGYWYSIRIRPYRTIENQIDGVTMVLQDIDALKRYTASLESARNYAETIIETVQIPLVVLDADFRVNTANRSFYQTFQVSEPETIHTLLFELGNGQWDIPELRSMLNGILAGEPAEQDFEVNHDFEQIGHKNMLLNACKLHQEDNTDMILLAILDVTERTARQQAEAASRAKDQFLSNLSHELRNPLTSLLAWVQLLRSRDCDEATVDQALEAIEQSGRLLNYLIEDILDASRITSGKLQLNSHPIDLSLLVQAALDSVSLSAVAKNIQLVSSLSSIAVLGDSERLQQVLGNLLSNAIKFTPAGGRVDITLSQVDNQAQIQVSDTGIGIPADLLPHIFERFYQGDSSTIKTNQGLGLGLAIVRHLIEMHGGTVLAESPGEGQGATMTVRLPLYVPPPSSPPIVEPTVETSLDASQNLPSLEGLKILVVDDQVDVLLPLQLMLETYGAEVLAVTTARAALSALRESPNRYDVLISDLGLPEEDGYFLIQQVRSLSAAAGGQIPAIALTGHASKAEEQRAIEAGFQMHIAKPCDLVQLRAIVADLAK
ncbi:MULTISPECIES: CheR family methyltransferase [Nostoc]|uniref:PAS domain-containing protein n=1 Tax=Nostoc paludosum FACHB-159 TaxID=2692908 RepID=A0ABR8KH00_9NOSO|nr:MULTISPECIES: CheR family methyltransferase [Nostoc]MBD2681753.1 PAS domain-containing protein [Nostoc sp. FACHB-857]MBD2738168.1 PAS domain-containing protein [Nostoc paludosum FACHB-159]